MQTMKMIDVSVEFVPRSAHNCPLWLAPQSGPRIRPGVDIHWIYREGGEGAAGALIRFQPRGRVPLYEHRGHEHILS
jgi:hypothetical protein